MYHVTDKDIKLAQSLSNFRFNAFKAGMKKQLFSDYRVNSGLLYTDFPAGKYMEVVMAWMLGYFRVTTSLHVWFGTNWRDDLFKSTDFTINDIHIDMKFDDARYHAPRGSIIAETFPAKLGKAEKTQTGMEALHTVLACVFSESIVKRSLYGREDFATLINSVWESTSSNW